MSSWNSKKNLHRGSKKESRTFLKSLIAQALQEMGQKTIQNQQQFQTNALLFLQNQVGRWGAYKARADEISLDGLVAECTHIDWVYPKMKGEVLEFCKAQDFERGLYGIWEPVATEIIESHQIQGLLIPGLGFNKDGKRLGRGKGFYDKYLQNFSGVKVGVCWSFQVLEHPLPAESHDVMMDYLLTEQGLIMCKDWS